MSGFKKSFLKDIKPDPEIHILIGVVSVMCAIGGYNLGRHWTKPINKEKSIPTKTLITEDKDSYLKYPVYPRKYF